MLIKPGTKVKMREDFKRLMSKNSKEHIEEFGNCIGIVIGNMYPDTDEYVDVRWQPSNLRYGYSINELIGIDTKEWEDYMKEIKLMQLLE